MTGPYGFPISLWVFAWLVIYQWIPCKANLSKSGLSDGLFHVCHRFEMVKHIMWDFRFAKSCWKYIQDQCYILLQYYIGYNPVEYD